jgi:endoglucanase
MVSHAKPSRLGHRLVLAATAVVAVATGLVVVALNQDDERDAGPVATGVTGPSSGPPAPVTGEPTTASPPSSAAAPSPSKPAGSAASGGLTGALYVDPAGAAAQQVKEFQNTGRAAEARLIRKIADRPNATWFADSAPAGVTRARQLVSTADRAGKLPVLTLYNIPYRDCSGQSAGGAASGDAYRSWVSSMAGALKGHPAVVVLEPDAVAQAVQGCLDEARKAERFKLLGFAVDALSRAGAKVYLDAGNPSWITDTAQMSDALRQAGVTRARGFALNVANFETTRANIEYGTALSGRLDGAHFVVDTSRNGNGPAPRGPVGDEHWCNPPGRKLGEVPTTRTGNALVDAYLWVKRPGESDGACSGGAPPAGQWWPEYALGLAR